MGLMGLGSGFYWQHEWLAGITNSHERYYLLKHVGNLKRTLLYLPVLLAMQLIYDRQLNGLYGISRKGFNGMPYLIMLAIVFPGIVWASFQPDFLRAYPSLKLQYVKGLYGQSDTVLFLGYELTYALRFVAVEIMFRGALVLGLARLLGKDAILPMAATYCYLHFGKPMGETISSIFGGYILGVIALHSRSILGGCFIHIGVAWLMDFTALLQIKLNE